MRTILCLLLSLLAALTLGGGASAWGNPEYKVSVVGPADSWPNGINQAGTVVGYFPVAPGVYRAFLNRGRGLVDLGALGGTQSVAVGINDRGEVLGNWRVGNGPWRGFLYARGRMRNLGALPGRETLFIGINNAGNTIVRGRFPASGNQFSYLRTPAGRLTNLGTLPSDAGAPGDPVVNNAYALNDRNQVTGESAPFTLPDQVYLAYLWDRGRLRNLGDLGSVPNTGRAINDHGQVTGTAALPTCYCRQAFLYSNGRMVALDTRPDEQEKQSAGNGINNRGHVVGSSDHLSAYIWRGRRMESLNALIDRRLGWDIDNAHAINDAGQIAAVGVRRGVRYAVRLDLIRPHVDAAPAAEPAAEPDPSSEQQTAIPPEAVAADAAAEAEAAAREITIPLEQ